MGDRCAGLPRSGRTVVEKSTSPWEHEGHMLRGAGGQADQGQLAEAAVCRLERTAGKVALQSSRHSVGSCRRYQANWHAPQGRRHWPLTAHPPTHSTILTTCHLPEAGRSVPRARIHCPQLPLNCTQVGRRWVAMQ